MASTVEMAVQVQGKRRGAVTVPADSPVKQAVHAIFDQLSL